ncbi:hypothetical protein Aperf_G00000129498 [Anoplocephala perfoliata]
MVESCHSHHAEQPSTLDKYRVTSAHPALLVSAIRATHEKSVDKITRAYRIDNESLVIGAAGDDAVAADIGIRVALLCHPLHPVKRIPNRGNNHVLLFSSSSSSSSSSSTSSCSSIYSAASSSSCARASMSGICSSSPSSISRGVVLKPLPI